MKNVIAELTL